MTLGYTILEQTPEQHHGWPYTKSTPFLLLKWEGKQQLLIGRYRTIVGARTGRQHASRRSREEAQGQIVERLQLEEVTDNRAFQRDVLGLPVPKFW